MDRYNRYLFLGCHLDDVEYGCGAFVNSMCNKGKEIYIAVLSNKNKNSKGEIQLSRDLQEAYDAIGELGIPKDHLILGNCYGQVFDQMQQTIRDDLIAIRNMTRPDAVFFPCMKDIHQDHEALSQNAFRIFREKNCFGYEVVRSSFDFFPQIYFEINEDELQRKKAAVMKYRSQITESAGYYFSEELIESVARFRGGQSGITLAEAFECYRQTILG